MKATEPKPRPLTPREADVFKALGPHLKDGCEFSHVLLARQVRMTRSLLNLYLTKLTRAAAIVRIAPGCYVLPTDPRALNPRECPKRFSKAKAEPKAAHTVPKAVLGVTLAMLMGGRARARRYQ